MFRLSLMNTKAFITSIGIVSHVEHSKEWTCIGMGEKCGSRACELLVSVEVLTDSVDTESSGDESPAVGRRHAVRLGLVLLLVAEHFKPSARVLQKNELNYVKPKKSFSEPQTAAVLNADFTCPLKCAFLSSQVLSKVG